MLITQNIDFLLKNFIGIFVSQNLQRLILSFLEINVLCKLSKILQQQRVRGQQNVLNYLTKQAKNKHVKWFNNIYKSFFLRPKKVQKYKQCTHENKSNHFSTKKPYFSIFLHRSSPSYERRQNFLDYPIYIFAYRVHSVYFNALNA